MFRRLPTACAALALALSTVTPARADETWTGTTSTDWFTAGNWAPAAVPTPSDNVTIDTVTPNATVVGAAGATANGLFVGVSGTGTLTIQNGGTVNSSGGGSIGSNSGSNGTVTVTGAGSSWTTNSSGLTIGDGGTGTLTIQNGATVSSSGGEIGFNSGSTGTVTVTGAGSSWTNSSGDLTVGNFGTGTLTIQNGGTVSSGNAIIGDAATGTVTVTGVGSSWTVSRLTVGNSGTGTLTIQNGGTLNSANATIGTNPGSTGTVTVDGAGSSWTTNATGLIVGNFGTGTLTIQNGGTVTSGGGIIGNSSGLTGTVAVTGAGSSWTILFGLSVGTNGTGTLTVQNGGTVNVAGTVTIAQFTGSTGTLNIGAASGQPAAAPGTLNTSSVAFGAGTGRIVFNHTASSYVFAPTISGAGSVGVEAGTTILTGTNTYTGATTINAGSTLQLGNGGAGGSIVGDVTDNGTLIFNRSDTYSFAGTVSGTGGLQQNGPGTTMLTGVSGYIGPTAINAGTLEVDGSIANSSSVTVAAGGTLSGIGAVAATTIMSGGTLAPGNATSPTGALTITGNLAFQSGALYLIGLNTASAGAARVSGTASLAGNVLAAFAPGSGAVRQYDILHSAGLGGTTFAAAGTTTPNFAASLSYSSTDVFLNLSPQLGSSGGLAGNQQAVANSIDNFFNGGGTLTPNFLSIFGLTGGNLANALSQLSGEAAADGEKGAFDLMTQFLGVMTDPHLGGPGGTAVLPFAAEPQAGLQRDADLPPEVALAYARALKAPGLVAKAPPSPVGWNVWGSGFGGTNKTGGDAVAGSHDVTARDSGFAAGADYRVSPDSFWASRSRAAIPTGTWRRGWAAGTAMRSRPASMAGGFSARPMWRAPPPSPITG